MDVGNGVEEMLLRRFPHLKKSLRNKTEAYQYDFLLHGLRPIPVRRQGSRIVEEGNRQALWSSWDYHGSGRRPRPEAHA